jgi:hypothetical protein
MQQRGLHSKQCNGSIILLGESCSRQHFIYGPMDHNIVDLDLALRMQANPRLINHYLEERAEIIKILRLLREHSKKRDPVKDKYMQELLYLMQEVLNKPGIEIEK